jgi:hypothetical protein
MEFNENPMENQRKSNEISEISLGTNARGFQKLRFPSKISKILYFQ